MHNFFKIIILFCFLISNIAFAQQQSRFSQQDKIWADVGLGLAENTGLVMNTALNYQRNHLIFTGQYIQTDELSLDIPCLCTSVIFQPVIREFKTPHPCIVSNN